MNEIRFDQPLSLVDNNKIQLDRNKATVPMSDNITINNSIRSLINTMSATHKSLPQDNRVAEMKSRIQSGQYEINHDQLANALVHQVFGKLV